MLKGSLAWGGKMAKKQEVNMERRGLFRGICNAKSHPLSKESERLLFQEILMVGC
jgi:hypothetical protein